MLGIYLRLSIEDEESNSIDNQLREGLAFAKKHHLKHKIYNEGKGVSGASALIARPVFKELLDDIEAGNINMVWSRNQNRISRSRVVFGKFLSAVDGKDVKVFFSDVEYDLNDPTAKLILGIFNEFNSYQVELQSQQTKKALLDNAKEGKAFGITPYGYTTDENGYFKINETESKIVKRIFALSLDGVGTRTIAQTLNDEGIPTRYNTINEGTITVKNKDTGKLTTRNKTAVRWAQNTVRGILKNTIYKGQRNWNDETFDLPQLQILDPHYWQKVNENLINNSNNRGKSVEHKYLLKGLLECFNCGRNYYGRTRVSKKDNYYMCSSKRYKNSTCNARSINIDVMESFIWDVMMSGNLYNKMIKTFADGGTEKRRNELSELIKSHRTKLDNLENERKRMINAVITGVLKENEVEGERKRITSAENDYSERLRKDSAELFELKNETRILEDINENLGYLKWNDEHYAKHLMRLDAKRKRDKAFKPSFNEKQRILKKYIRRILIGNDSGKSIYILTVKYNLPIADETYLIDYNYLSALNVNDMYFVPWNRELTRRFRPEKFIETNKNLIDYSVINWGSG